VIKGSSGIKGSSPPLALYETDPLTCPKCQGEMRIISFIDQPDVIKKILQHLGLWEESHVPPGRDPPVKEIT